MTKDVGCRLIVAAATVLLGAASIGLAATAGNGLYTVAVEDLPSGVGLGVYTCTTGAAHPVTASRGVQDVLVGRGTPGTSFTTIRSYTSGTDYVQRNGVTLAAGAPPTLELEGFVAPGEEAIPVGDPLAPTGFTTIYRPGGLLPAPDNLVITQTVEAVGTDFDDSAVVLRTEITNSGSTDISIGVRYLWDLTIGSNDDGPTFAARNPDGATLTTATEFLDPAFDTFQVRDDNTSAACFGMNNSPVPYYFVQGSVSGPASLAPTPPTRLAYVSWPDASGLPGKFGGVTPAVDAFDYQTFGMNVSACLVTLDDTGVAAWWGDTAGNAAVLAPGETVAVEAFLYAHMPGTPPVFPAVGTEGPAGDPTCSDALDNDGDGLVDAGDPDCFGQSAEGPFDDPTCFDALDNDLDGLTDIDDPDCIDPATLVEGPYDHPSCFDAVDNDGDGLVDIDDPDCTPPPPPVEGPYNDPSCADGVDNDGDGFVDLDDPDCVPPPPPVEGPHDDPSCWDGADNDGDGLVDLDDPDCVPPPPPVEGPYDDPSCSDGLDNDGDGFVDLDDADCVPPTGQEGPPGDPSCSDRVDNDGDGMLDGNDPGCVPATNSPPDCSAAAPSPTRLWPANHRLQPVEVVGVTDADGDPIAITVTSVMQDEPVASRGDGNTCPDVDGIGGTTVLLRAERSAISDGRVYHLAFTADDGMGGQCSGVLTVCVPHSRRRGMQCIDQGPIHDSTSGCTEKTGRGRGRR